MSQFEKAMVVTKLKGARDRKRLALAQAAWRAGEGIDPALALPLYVRDKVAETSDERAAKQIAAAGS